jgi:hypothetical protein
MKKPTKKTGLSNDSLPELLHKVLVTGDKLAEDVKSYANDAGNEGDDPDSAIEWGVLANELIRRFFSPDCKPCNRKRAAVKGHER